MIRTTDLADLTREDGTDYPHVMVVRHDPDLVYAADAAGELIHALNPRYTSDLSDVDAASELATFSEDRATTLQRAYVAQAIANGDLDTEDEDWLTLLMTEKHLPILTGDSEPLAYELGVPLVISTSAYITVDGETLPLPTGNVQIIDPSTETNFLASLAELGFIDYRRSVSV